MPDGLVVIILDKVSILLEDQLAAVGLATTWTVRVGTEECHTRVLVARCVLVLACPWCYETDDSHDKVGIDLLKNSTAPVVGTVHKEVICGGADVKLTRIPNAAYLKIGVCARIKFIGRGVWWCRL